MGKPDRKRPLGRPSCRWEENIKMYLRMGCGGMDWIDLNQDRALVNGVMKLPFP